MTVKSAIRFLVGLLLAALILNIAVPFINIPRAQLYPPPYIYSNATGKTQGVVTKRFKLETSDPFHVGDKVSFIGYEFHAPYTPLFLGDQKSDPQKLYSGVAQVKNENYDNYKEGITVRIKYETTYPEISGIDSPEGGMNGGKAGLLSGWIGWAIGTVVFGYFLAGVLERIMLRESF